MTAKQKYLKHKNTTYGDIYESSVKRFQEGFLKDKVCNDIDHAFEKAVEVCEKLIKIFKIQSAK